MESFLSRCELVEVPFQMTKTLIGNTKIKIHFSVICKEHSLNKMTTKNVEDKEMDKNMPSICK